MNELQRFLKLINRDALGIAEASGINYHSVQKNIKGERANSHIQAAIAAELGHPREKLFGPMAKSYLRKLIKQEIRRVAIQKQKDLKALYLPRKAAQGHGCQ